MVSGAGGEALIPKGGREGKTKVLAGEEKSVAVQHVFSEQDKIRKARGGDTGADTQAI
jgi:hypothetical protein